MKTGLIILMTVFSIKFGIAQNIKDYYIPDGKTKSVFYKPDPNTGGKAPVQTIITITKKSDDNYSIKEERKVNNNLASTLIRLVILDETKVKIVNTTSISLYGGENEYSHNPALIFIQIPSNNEKSIWNYTNIHGEKINCSAEWTMIEKDGNQIKALKVVRETYENDKKIDWATSIEYYVKGIGLFKITSGKDIDSDILDYQN